MFRFEFFYYYYSKLVISLLDQLTHHFWLYIVRITALHKLSISPAVFPIKTRWKEMMRRKSNDASFCLYAQTFFLSFYQYWEITVLPKLVIYRHIEIRNLWFSFVDVFLAYVSCHSKIGYLTSFSLSNQDVPGCKVAVNNLSNIIQSINE